MRRVFWSNDGKNNICDLKINIWKLFVFVSQTAISDLLNSDDLEKTYFTYMTIYFTCNDLSWKPNIYIWHSILHTHGVRTFFFLKKHIDMDGSDVGELQVAWSEGKNKHTKSWITCCIKQKSKTTNNNQNKTKTKEKNKNKKRKSTKKITFFGRTNIVAETVS